MAYLAIARKWRPARFEDLIGQEHVVQTLKNAISFQRVSHAYLFSGARGVGKTSVARIFAKALRCPNTKEGVACDTCEECLAIRESRSVDVVEIDGASNNGVEAVRGIRENVAYGAACGFYKIYIIDEVHMLSLSAFNALLKTLEEPPPHVIFLFATTESQKIPLTILSRCQRFEFRRLTLVQITQRLEEILKTEKLAIHPDGLRLIAAHADGSLRDALSLLDQVLSFYGKEREAGETIDEQKVGAALGVSETSQVSAFLEQIINKDIPQILKRVEEVYSAGVDLKHFSERVLAELRLLYLVSLSAKQKLPLTPESLDVASGQLDSLKALAEKTSILRLERMSQIFSKAITQLAWSSLPRFVLEMAAVRMSELDELEKVEKAVAGQPVVFQAAAAPVVAASPAPTPTPTFKPTIPAAPSNARANAIPAPQPKAPPAPVTSAPSRPMDEPPAYLSNGGGNGSERSWKAFVDTVMKKRPLLGALLCHSQFKMESRPDGKVVILSFPEGSFYEKQALDTKNRSDIEDQLRGFFGPDTKLNLSAGAASTIKSIEAGKQAEAAQLKKAALEHPTVQKMKEILGAEVVDVNVEMS